jgi:hypothetical protein
MAGLVQQGIAKSGAKVLNLKFYPTIPLKTNFIRFLFLNLTHKNSFWLASVQNRNLKLRFPRLRQYPKRCASCKKRTDGTLRRSETEIRNIWSNWTDKQTEPCFYNSTENDKISIFPAAHFLKFLCQPAFGTFAKPLKPTHNPSFAKEPNHPPTVTKNNSRFISYILIYYFNLAGSRQHLMSYESNQRST